MSIPFFSFGNKNVLEDYLKQNASELQYYTSKVQEKAGARVASTTPSASNTVLLLPESSINYVAVLVRIVVIDTFMLGRFPCASPTSLHPFSDWLQETSLQNCAYDNDILHDWKDMQRVLQRMQDFTKHCDAFFSTQPKYSDVAKIVRGATQIDKEYHETEKYIVMTFAYHKITTTNGEPFVVTVELPKVSYMLVITIWLLYNIEYFIQTVLFAHVQDAEFSSLSELLESEIMTSITDMVHTKLQDALNIFPELKLF